MLKLKVGLTIPYGQLAVKCLFSRLGRLVGGMEASHSHSEQKQSTNGNTQVLKLLNTFSSRFEFIDIFRVIHLEIHSSRSIESLVG